MKSTKRRSGFTLPEILVTVTIIAVLAAVVVPAVIQQVNKGDAPSAASDVISIRTAINSFATDMRRFPRSLGQLTANQLLSDSVDIDNNKYGSDNGRFHGPYLTASGEGHITPSGIVFGNKLTVTNNMVCMKDSADANGSVKALAQAPASSLDQALDNANGKTDGLVTWQDSSGAPGFVKAGTLQVCLVSKG